MENGLASNVVPIRAEGYTHRERVQRFEEAEDVTRPARERSERDLDYFHEKQLTDTEISELKGRGQPPVIFNEIKPKVNTMLGIEKQTRKDPKALPRTPNDEKSAEVVTDAIRYVCEDSRWDDKRSQAAFDLAVPGTCAIMVGFRQAKGAIDPDIRRIPWDRFYHDPASAEFDFSDAKYMGIVLWMELDDAIRLYPEAEDVLTATWSSARNAGTYDDKPKHGLWGDYRRRRVRLCEEFYNDGGWKFCIYTGAGDVVPEQDSPYLDEEDKPSNPISAVSLYVDRDNARYGEVRTMISPQDEVNKRRSKALHITNTRQIRVSPNVAIDAKEARKELSRPDGVFIGENGDVEVLQTADMAVGNLNLLQDARAHIHRTGANNALAGKDTQGQSGRAITAQQQGGLTEAATYLDCIRVLSLAVYRQVWNRCRQAWTAGRWIRITEDEGSLRFVGLNVPVTALQVAQQQYGEDPQAQQMLQAFAQSPEAQQIVGVENNVAELDVDILVDEGIDTPTVQAEQFDVVAKMLPGAPPQLQPVLWQALFENSAFRNKDKVLKALSEPPSEQQQMAEQVQLETAVAEKEKTESETMKNVATAQATQAGMVTDAFRAGAGGSA